MRRFSSCYATAARPARYQLGYVRWWLALPVALAAIAAVVYFWLPRQALARELVSAEPAIVLKSPKLVDFALRVGRPAYDSHCAACHGASGEGNQTKGVPALNDQEWLFGKELITLEQIVLYGIRSGHPKSKNLTDMPALGRTGQLGADDVQDVLNYVLQLGGSTVDVASAERGKKVYYGKGVCYDCHASDARGVIDYGTPPLNGKSWVYGGDRENLLISIRDGRHGLCPSWVKVLTPLQIRAIAVYLNQGVKQSV
jgi:cytochrome c oxidase cbb3-type subunit 3